MATDISGVVLHKLLSSPEEALEVFPKLKPSFFGAGYINIYTAITKFYTKRNALPSFYDLLLVSRDGLTKNSINSLQELEVPEDIDWLLLLEALIDQYTQDETLTKLDTFLDNITSMDTQEIKQKLTDIVFYLEEKTHVAEEVYTAADLTLAEDEELGTRVPLGINNTFDALTGGIALSELIFIGGERGSGKSIVAVNIVNNQYLQGNVSALFSIEMRAQEVYWRMLSSMAGVRFSAIRKNTLTDVEVGRVAKVVSEMYVDSSELYEKFVSNRDYKELEKGLSTTKRLKPENQLVIIDNQQLTLADIDMNIQKLKSQAGDKLKVVVVDYVNQIEIEDIYNWQSQITLSKGLKNLARKHNIVIVAPYQIDKTGEARFAKGLLDAVDMAITLKAGKDYIAFETTKVRNIPATKFASGIDWETLNISPQDAVISTDDAVEPSEDEEKSKFKKKPKKDAKGYIVKAGEQKPDDLPF